MLSLNRQLPSRNLPHPQTALLRPSLLAAQPQALPPLAEGVGPAVGLRFSRCRFTGSLPFQASTR